MPNTEELQLVSHAAAPAAVAEVATGTESLGMAGVTLSAGAKQSLASRWVVDGFSAPTASPKQAVASSVPLAVTTVVWCSEAEAGKDNSGKVALLGQPAAAEAFKPTSEVHPQAATSGSSSLENAPPNGQAASNMQQPCKSAVLDSTQAPSAVIAPASISGHERNGGHESVSGQAQQQTNQANHAVNGVPQQKTAEARDNPSCAMLPGTTPAASVPDAPSSRGAAAGGRGGPRGLSGRGGGGRGRGMASKLSQQGDASAGLPPDANGSSRKRTGPADSSDEPDSKRTRRPTAARLNGYSEGSELRAMIVGTRIGIYWDGDATYYRGKLTGCNSGKYQIRYDDGESEWLALDQEKFVWYAPRGRSAGYRAALHEQMVLLGARNLPAQPGPVEPPSTPSNAGDKPAAAEDAIGRRISVYWQADGQWYTGEVLAYNPRTGRYHVLYNDGEDEWLELSKEHIAWHKPTRGAPAVAVGLCEGAAIPHGRSAVGWRVSVYWKDDMTFYEGKIMGYDSATGRHQILYDDGESEFISLHGEKVVWKVSFGVIDVPANDSESDSAADSLRDYKVPQRGPSAEPCTEGSRRQKRGTKLDCAEDEVSSQRKRGSAAAPSTAAVASSLPRAVGAVSDGDTAGRRSPTKPATAPVSAGVAVPTGSQGSMLGPKFEVANRQIDGLVGRKASSGPRAASLPKPWHLSSIRTAEQPKTGAKAGQPMLLNGASCPPPPAELLVPGLELLNQRKPKPCLRATSPARQRPDALGLGDPAAGARTALTGLDTQVESLDLTGAEVTVTVGDPVVSMVPVAPQLPEAGTGETPQAVVLARLQRRLHVLNLISARVAAVEASFGWTDQPSGNATRKHGGPQQCSKDPRRRNGEHAASATALKPMFARQPLAGSGRLQQAGLTAKGDMLGQALGHAASSTNLCPGADADLAGLQGLEGLDDLRVEELDSLLSEIDPKDELPPLLVA